MYASVKILITTVKSSLLYELISCHFLIIQEPTVICEALYSVHKHYLLLKLNS